MKPLHTLAVRSPSRSAAALGLTIAFGIGLGFSHSAEAGTRTAASLDWSSFTAVTSDPGFAFIVDPSYGTTVTAFTESFAPSFTAALSAGDAGTGVAASADANTLSASVTSATGQGFAPRSADVTRAADFTLDNGASVIFSLRGTVSTNDASNPLTTSFASLAVIGGDLGYQVSSLGLVASGSDQSQTGVLSFTVTNTSGAAITGYLAAEGTVGVDTIAAVPEPATALLLLPGLVIGGLVVSRRRPRRR